jgi:hypothetical protein
MIGVGWARVAALFIGWILGESLKVERMPRREPDRPAQRFVVKGSSKQDGTHSLDRRQERGGFQSS